MSGPCLSAEFEAANCRLKSKHKDHLAGLGVPEIVRIGAPPIVGVEYVDTADCERYWPQEQGSPAYVVPVFDGGPESLVHTTYDLVAFKPSQPDTWWLRKCHSALLGPDWPEWCRIHNEPLRLFSSPLEWLRGSGHGSCIVDWSVHLPIYFRGVRNIICDSTDLASRVHSVLNDIGSVPNIHVTREAVNVAA